MQLQQNLWLVIVARNDANWGVEQGMCLAGEYKVVII